MGTTLHTLAPAKGATKNKKRLGRGRGSGTGKTSGKGVKGTHARAGHHGPRRGFEGGQMPMKMRIAKRGFKNPFRVEAHPINLRTLEDLFEAGATVDVDALRDRGLVPKRVEVVKILAEGELTKALHVSAHRFSVAAKQKIEQAGGSATTLEAPAADAAGVDNPDAAQ